MFMYVCVFQNPRKVHSFQPDMDDSRKSSESECSDSTTSDSSSDEDQMPVKKPFVTYADPDESASSICPPLSIASAEGTTVLRRSLRKVIEESKKDAASSVSNSRESTPPRTSSSGRRISSQRAYSPGSGSRPASLLRNNSRGTVSAEVTRVAKHGFQRRSARIGRLKRVVDDSVAKSLPVGVAESSDDDSNSVKESRKIGNSVSSLNMMIKSSHSASLVDTSDTDSRASSLCAYSMRSAASGQISTAKSNRRSSPSVKQKARNRSRMFTCGRGRLSKMQTSDSETDSQTNALRTSFFDSFPDNSSNGSSIASSVRNAELSTNLYVDNCKYAVGSSSEGKEMRDVKLDLDEAVLKKNAEFDTNEEDRHNYELKSESPPNASQESMLGGVPEIKFCLRNKDAHFQNETDESNESASDILVQKAQLSGENRSAASAVEDGVIETKEEEKDASLKINCNDLEAAEEDMKVKDIAGTGEEAHIADQTEDEEAKADGHSKPASNDGSEDQDVNMMLKEEEDEMSNVQEEPPEILVSVTHLL